MNKKRILVLGSAGMLGHVVYTYLDGLNKYDVINSSFPRKFNSQSILLDATNTLGVEKAINEFRPNVLINCIGVLIKGSRSDPANAIYLNSFLPHQLSKLLQKSGGKLIHISTDCVFSGKKGGYKENDIRDAYDVYGTSKSLGEVINDTDLTFRTSIIGPELNEHGEGLLHWFFNQKGEIKGYTNAFWSGVTTLYLATAIEKAIDSNITGLYHVTNGIKISKFDLLRIVQKVYNKHDLIITPFEGFFVDKSFKNTRSDIRLIVPSYEEMLIALKEFMEQHNQYYKHYGLN